jgi:hypothetical protein
VPRAPPESIESISCLFNVLRRNRAGSGALGPRGTQVVEGGVDIVCGGLGVLDVAWGEDAAVCAPDRPVKQGG